MKNKPLRHKESNTFKFQPFSERIASINVDIFHHVAHRYEEDSEGSETFFYQALQKWNVLNLSESYDLLRKQITNNIQTLPQLLTQKDRLVSVLLDHLSNSNPLSLQAVLEFVVAFARDLRQEFYPHYSEFLAKLISLLHTKDTDQLEWTFTCLAYLFKFLWRFLVRDLTTVFESLLPFLSTSKPQYINSFAAESFAFVARKVKDRRSFLKLILRSLIQNPDGIAGCGRLLFETIHGVSGQFHTCAEPFLTFLLQSLADDGLPSKLLFKVLTHMVSCIPESIYTKHSSVYWQAMQVAVCDCSTSWKTDKSERVAENMAHLLSLIHNSVQVKGGVFVLDAPALVDVMAGILQESDWPTCVLSVIVDVFSSLLLSLRVNLSQEIASKLIRKVLLIEDTNVVKMFVQQTLSYSGFEALILPGSMALCCQLVPLESLRLISEIILHKSPPSLSFEKIQQWKRYQLDISSKNKEYSAKLNDLLYTTLDIDSVDDVINHMEQVTRTLTVIPHLQGVDKDVMSARLSSLITLLCNHLSDAPEAGTIQCSIFVVSIALVTLMHLAKDVALSLCQLLVQSLLPFAKTSQHVVALKALDVLITEAEQEPILGCFDTVRKALVDHLSSPFHEVRLVTAHILLQLEIREDAKNIERSKLLSLIQTAETVPATVHDYREKLKHLQLLECNDSAERMSQSEYPLKYLLGCLYINFKLMWEPVSKIIASYAVHLPAAQFWQVFEPQLRLAVHDVKEDNNAQIQVSLGSEFVNGLYVKESMSQDKPDYVNYRILLWQNMTHFSDVCEVKNRDISNLFLTFLQEEYFRKNVSTATTWNIKQKKNSEVDDSAMEVDKVPNEDDDIKEALVQSSEEELNKSFKSTGRTATKSLLAHLGVFSKLRNPRSLFREPELNKAYFEFLTHKNPAIQKAALDCIMSYKNKSLIPYRDHLYGLIEDKTFKDEVTLFRVDTESDAVRPEHRPELIPIVMRIVYSKMLNKSGVRTGSNNSNSIRRNVVFRFLAGCKEEELLQYLQMAFRIFSSTVKDNVKNMVQEVMSSLDLEQMIPPKRLMSTVNLLMVVLSQCGSLMGDTLLHFLLRVLLCVGATVTAALRVRDDVHQGYFNVLKNIRNLCIDVLTKFFSSFEAYSWTADELDVVFEIFVWPWLEKLPTEGIHSPTSLMKLFTAWSQNPRYFVLLNKHSELDQSVTPLPYIMKLLIANKVHGSVLNVIMDSVERMLTLREALPEDETAEGEDGSSAPLPLPPLPDNNTLSVTTETITKFKMSEDLNFGSRLLLPHIPPILEYMQKKLTKNGPKRGLPQREVNVLSRITEFVNDATISDSLLSLLLPIISKKSGSSEHILCPLLVTVCNLMENVEKPSRYLRKLAPLFGTVSSSEPRKMLTGLVLLIASEESKLDGALLEDLNAWDAKWLDQPDFMRRLDAFKKIKLITSSGDMTVEMGVIIIHTCFHYLHTEKDLSLRDSAGQCLRTLCPALSQAADRDSDFVINHTVLTLLCAGIRNKKNDIVQQESIAVLGYMARECAHLHPVLKDLSLLSNRTDLEVDFFENLQHLQLHRKVRALLKFSDVSKSLSKAPSPRTLTQFVLPLVSQFLCSEKYVNKNSLVDAAIEALGTISRLLPWHQYEMVLRYYLAKLRHALEFQKQLIRVVVAILNAFHFDLSRGKLGKNQHVPEEVKKETEVQVETKALDKVTDKDEVENADDSQNEDEEENKDDKEFEENLQKDINEEEEETLFVPEVLAVEKQNVLTEAAATRVIHIIRTGLLPQLNRTITMRVQSDNLHKVNRKMAGPDKDEEDILRIPIVLAFVKLLQRLPAQVMQQNLSGVLMKLCTFLKSRLDSVRRVTRETLQKVMVTLGPEYLPILLEEMNTLLTRGFHVHVLVYSVHSVLVALKDLFQSGHMDLCVRSILQVCKLDLFGSVAEEKEVAQIAGKLMEARASRSYDTFHLMARFITDKCLLDIILPLKEELTRTLSHKTVNKVSECLRQIVLGLVDNQFVNVESLLVFAYGTASESIPVLINGLKPQQTTEQQEAMTARQRPDTFIIPAEPKSRPKVEGKLCAKTNAHILVEFGLRLYYFMLKRDKLKSADFRPHLDPLVIVLRDALMSQHVKLSTLSLQCLCWVFKFDLPSLKTNLNQISKLLFQILHKYASAGLSKGDNFDLVMAAFKAVAVLVRDVKNYTISPDQLRVLLLYCEQDIQDYTRQATAFTLLKAVVKRKLLAPELHAVMGKVANISITADLDHVRLQARQVFHQFLVDYPLGKKLDKHISFYVSQLQYELKPGRQSALEMLKTLILSFPQNILTAQCELFFIHLGACLVNDNDPGCRKMAADIIILLLDKVDKNLTEKLFDIVLLWMKDTKIVHRRLGAQLCGIFVAHEKKDFERHLPSLLPIILDQFCEGFAENRPGHLLRVEEETTVDVKEKLRDHHLYQVMHMLVKVTVHCPKLLTEPTYTGQVERLAENAQSLLAHPHEWVRLCAAQFLGKVMSVFSPSDISAILNDPQLERAGFLLNNTRERIKSLSLDFCGQLTPGVEVEDKLLMQTMKNLVFVAEILKDVKEVLGQDQLSLTWLVRRFRKLINIEITRAPTFNSVRTMSFNWMAAVVLKLDKESLRPVLFHILAPLVRELNIVENAGTPLHQVAKEAANYVRRKIGSEEYNDMVAKLTTRMNIKRAERRKERVQQVITQPEKAAKRKITKQLKKKDQKKRKLEYMKGHKVKRKATKAELDFGV